MVTAEFQPFFTASVAASAGLIGLLFVSVSIAPERVFGPAAEAGRQAQALSAFSALANIFFISMASLIPRAPFGVVVVIISSPAIIQTFSLLELLPHWRAAHIMWRGLFLFLASAAVYFYELAIGIQMWSAQSASSAQLDNLLFLLLGAYAIGLGRAWELLGAPRSGVIATLTDWIGARMDRSTGEKPKPNGKPPGRP